MKEKKRSKNSLYKVDSIVVRRARERAAAASTTKHEEATYNIVVAMLQSAYANTLLWVCVVNEAYNKYIYPRDRV